MPSWEKTTGGLTLPRYGAHPAFVKPPNPPGAVMDKFIERKNIAHYIDQLKTETDPTERNTLQTLLTEETCRLKQSMQHRR